MKQNEGEYQGWTNYQTWAVALWIDNDAANYQYWQTVVATAIDGKPDAVSKDQETWIVDQSISHEVALRLEDEIVGATPLGEGASLYSDLLSHSLDQVNWNEIASHWMLAYAE